MIQALLESAKGAWLEKSQLIHRIECQVEYIDFTALLHTVDDTEFSYYWQDRDSDYESLGLGSSDVHNGTDMATLGPLLDRLQQQLSGKGPRYRYLGGNRFNQESHQDPTWEPIYSFRYMLPLLEYCKHDGQYYLAMYYRLSDFDSVDLLCEQLQEDFRRLTAAKERTSVTVDIESTTLSDKASVIQCITNAIHAIKQSDHLKKLVVAAKQELRFSNTIAALQLAHHAGLTPNATTDDDFQLLRAHFSEEQILELVAVIAMFGFLNRWNDTLGTTLETEPAAVREKLNTVAITQRAPS